MPEHLGVEIDFHGTPQQLRKLAVFMQDLRSFWPLLVPVVTGWWRRQFETQGGFGGTGWAPLSAAYADRKAHTHPGAGILVATGAMRQAASRPRRAQTPTSLTLSIDDPKIGYHQDGTTKMPARPIVFGEPLPAVARVEMQEVAEVYVRDLLGRF